MAYCHTPLLCDSLAIGDADANSFGNSPAKGGVNAASIWMHSILNYTEPKVLSYFPPQEISKKIDKACVGAEVCFRPRGSGKL